MRKTKIICTLGPASDSEEMVRKLMLAGMNVARFNFSHQGHTEHKKRFDTVVKVREELGLPVATLLDTKGPEIRLGLLEGGEAFLKAGDTFTLTTRPMTGNAEMASISYPGLPGDVHEGGRILIDDGLIALEIQKVTHENIVCKVINGGRISDRKGVNVPDVSLSMPFLSERDREDILFGIETGFDFIAASFTIRVSDGIMVARGDMGVEIAFEHIPVLQKRLIKKAYKAGKQVITATQMLESMIHNPRPTRAEATDVANAIYDGTSAIMLSGETAAGDYPEEAVKVMATIAKRTEADIDYEARFRQRRSELGADVTDAISHATVTTSMDLGAKYIVTVTKSGKTAKMISKYRPSCPIIACSPEMFTVRQLNLSWGVIPIFVEEKTNTDELFAAAFEAAKKRGLLRNGDLVVTTAGVPLGISGNTNLLRVDTIGNPM